ncbi:MAG TPA: hypothetical protein VGI39_34275 [Polyangiaceae bacterium]
MKLRARLWTWLGERLACLRSGHLWQEGWQAYVSGAEGEPYVVCTRCGKTEARAS